MSAEQTFASNVELVIEDISYVGQEGIPGGIAAQLVYNNSIGSLFWVGPDGEIFDQEQIRRVQMPDTYCPIVTGL